jgi:dTDP-4-dehydrorhamnose 3,5-epimerase
MNVHETTIDGAWLIDPDPKGDHRGYFMRTYDEAIWAEHGLVTRWVQENESLTQHRGTVRGLHFQKPPHAETKLVRVVRGAVQDVFVDIRKDSPTFGQWGSAELSAENHRMLYLPKGIAHGFCTLSDDVMFLYKVDAAYAPQAEGGVIWNDATLAIDWPVDDPILSDKDRRWPGWDEVMATMADVAWAVS